MPLWQHAYDQAKASKYVDTIIVSTDEHRPPELCSDTASCEDVLRHHQAQTPHDWIVLVQPTSPLRTTADIDACIERAQMGEACISVCHGRANGAVYVASAAYLAAHDFTHGGMKYQMPEERSLDINTEDEWALLLESSPA